jgi:hypothetical protein
MESPIIMVLIELKGRNEVRIRLEEDCVFYIPGSERLWAESWSLLGLLPGDSNIVGNMDRDNRKERSLCLDSACLIAQRTQLGYKVNMRRCRAEVYPLLSRMRELSYSFTDI